MTFFTSCDKNILNLFVNKFWIHHIPISTRKYLSFSPSLPLSIFFFHDENHSFPLNLIPKTSIFLSSRRLFRTLKYFYHSQTSIFFPSRWLFSFPYPWFSSSVFPFSSSGKIMICYWLFALYVMYGTMM